MAHKDRKIQQKEAPEAADGVTHRNTGEPEAEVEEGWQDPTNRNGLTSANTCPTISEDPDSKDLSRCSTMIRP